MKVPPFAQSTEEIRADLGRLRHPVTVAVIRAKNAFNVGAIIRVAHSFLVEEIVLVGDEPFYGRAAMGMQKYEHVTELPDDDALVAHAREKGRPLVVFEKDHARENLWTCELPAPACLVFGSEDLGVGERLVAAAELRVGIPMHGINHSFPVAIAAGIAMGEWTRRYLGQWPGGRG